mmetsp:Transcript_375/g.1087  ORF Transcript_375/g.1087 Transcript_375/m.1087 type:complete len:314 (+) Transcript_375:1522-2463(+)
MPLPPPPERRCISMRCSWRYRSACELALDPSGGSSAIRFSRLAGFFAFRRRRCCSSCAAVGRLAGSFCRHAATKSWKSFEKAFALGPATVGGARSRILTSTTMGASSAYGARPVASSMAVMPMLQMSALVSYPELCCMTSGAMKSGLPMKVWQRLCLEVVSPASVIHPMTPKSERKTAPRASRSRFPALMSRWIWPCPWKYSTAQQISLSTYATMFSSSPPGLAAPMNAATLPPAYIGVTSHTSVPCTIAVRSLTTLRCSTPAITPTSFQILSQGLWHHSKSKIFTATSLSTAGQYARNTAPVVPCPIFSLNS